MTFNANVEQESKWSKKWRLTQTFVANWTENCFIPINNNKNAAMMSLWSLFPR